MSCIVVDFAFSVSSVIISVRVISTTGLMESKSGRWERISFMVRCATSLAMLTEDAPTDTGGAGPFGFRRPEQPYAIMQMQKHDTEIRLLNITLASSIAWQQFGVMQSTIVECEGAWRYRRC